MEKNKKSVLAFHMIGSAIIWAATILSSSLLLKESFSQISLLLSSASAIHLIIWGSLAAQLKKQRKEDKLKQG